MRIAQLSTPHLPTPPVGYGASELIASLITEELVRRGHEVTLFAHGDSVTSARFIHFPQVEEVQRFDYRELAHVGRAMALSDGFDVVHNHCLFAGPAMAGLRDVRCLSTLHYTHPVLACFPEHPYVAVSHAQKAANPRLNVVGVVHNAVDLRLYQPSSARQDYLLFLGRFHPNKGVDLAIRVADRLGARLLIAAPTPHPDQRGYFDEHVAPHIGHRIEYLGEVTGEQKCRLLAEARCLLMPDRWEEPFGLVALEAAASGTPVVAMRKGALPELVLHGETGFLVDSVEEMIEAVRRVDSLDPTRCRQHATTNFSVGRMVDGYLELYEKAIQGRL
jgi:glycosyltransferase involved in cell wall biosynthesis